MKAPDYTPEEDRRIRALRDAGMKWREVAEHFPGRQPDALKERLNKVRREERREWDPLEEIPRPSFDEDYHVTRCRDLGGFWCSPMPRPFVAFLAVPSGGLKRLAA